MEEVRVKLEKAVQGVFDVDDFEVEVMVAPEAAGADYASNVAMKLASKVGRAPREVAAELAEALRAEGLEVEIAGPGFLNFILSNEYFSAKIAEIDENLPNLGKNITQSEYLNKTVVAEFSDPNPFKVLHVGHLYTSVVGDAMARMMECAGAKVIRANFGGDVGLHVAKTMYVMLREKALFNDFEMPEGMERPARRAAWMAHCYVEGTRLYEESVEARREIREINKKIYLISDDLNSWGMIDKDDLTLEDLSRFQDGDKELIEVYFKGRKWSYDYFRQFYEMIGLKFDKYYPESMVAKRGLKKVQEGLAAGVYGMSDGAVIFPGEKYDLHTRVFINKEGLPTYEAKDVGLIFQKWDDWKFDESIVITGNDIIDYMKVVLKSVEMIDSRLSDRTKHITHGMVKLKGAVKMSSRLGNFLGAEEVLRAVDESLHESYGRYDSIVALGAVKYAFLRNRVGGNIIFDAEESVSMSGNSGPYLQYSVVRARRILSKINVGEVKIGEEERDLAKKVVQYPGVLAEAVGELAPHKLCNYLYELAQEFSRFYEKVAVAGSEREAERGKLVQVYNNIMTQGLGLLGIEVPEEM